LASSQAQPTLFDLVISPLDRESFTSEYWGKSFLRFPGTPGRFKFLLSWEELSDILETHRFEPPRLRLARAGKAIDPNLYLAGNKEVKPVILTNLLSEGATLILDSIDAIQPPIRQLVEDFEEIIQTRVTVNLYAGWRTETGLNLHWDPQDTMILQVAGRKQWVVYAPTRIHPLETDVDSTPQPASEPVWDGILEDGDMIYLPRGWWHLAVPLDEPSLHLTVTIVPPNGFDFLRWCNEQLRGNPEVRMNVPQLAAEDERKAYVQRLRELLTEFYSDDIFERFLSEWQSAVPMRPRLRLPFAPVDSRQPITMQTRVQLASSRQVTFFDSQRNGLVPFLASGIQGECSVELVPALKLISGRTSHSVNELCAQLKDPSLAPKLMILLTGLAMRGAVRLEQ
jgi:ribosomal protein L16 Arg81 hydroxylase